MGADAAAAAEGAAALARLRDSTGAVGAALGLAWVRRMRRAGGAKGATTGAGAAAGGSPTSAVDAGLASARNAADEPHGRLYLSASNGGGGSEWPLAQSVADAARYADGWLLTPAAWRLNFESAKRMDAIAVVTLVSDAAVYQKYVNGEF